MKTMLKHAHLCILPAMAMLAGCLSSGTPAATEWTVAVEKGAVRHVAAPKFGVARLLLVDVRAPYAGREIAVLRGDGSVAFDPYNTFAATPLRLMTGGALDALAGSGLFSAVVEAGSSADSDVDVEVAVLRMALDCRVEGSRRAVVALSVRLVRSHRIVAYAIGEGACDAGSGDYSASFSAAAASAFGEAFGNL